KLLLQEHFKKCMYPSFDQRKELAVIIGVTEKEIKVCIALVPFSLSKTSYGACTFISPVPLVIPQCLEQLGTIVDSGPMCTDV
ncbi:homeobox domain-containing protein, partial [Sphingobium sp. AS12]|uniref:homeobox domain-containing protein n=1 Tax=Sphingobium sp. AS12 TaxID=2849495 RepID=UPI001C31BFC4